MGAAMLSEAERTEARRFLGYPVHGVGVAGNSAWQFYQASGAVEYRLSNLATSEEAVLRKYLSTLEVLEAAIPAVGAGLDTGSAAGWTRNPAELSERGRLFDDWRRRFCAFMGVPAGPGLGQQRASVGLVV